LSALGWGVDIIYLNTLIVFGLDAYSGT
jgi:hypothetical protein